MQRNRVSPGFTAEGEARNVSGDERHRAVDTGIASNTRRRRTRKGVGMPSAPPFGTTAPPLEDPLSFLPCSHILEYQRKQMIYGPDRAGGNLYLLIAGKVMVRRIVADGERELLVDI